MVIAKWTLIAFGIFFIGVAGLMFFNPKRARSILRKAGSTPFIHFAELSLRMIPGIAFIVYANSSNFPFVFNCIGWFIIISSLILMIIPRKMHHQFSNTAADVLKPPYFQWLSPISVLIGGILLYHLIN